MPLQNRVTPFGKIIADPARGMFTGNRGCLCDEPGKLARRRWRLKAWITCQLSYKGWRRAVMQPGVWTELFFLDEPTALAAGHRPCALCRRPAYDRYRRAWAAAQGLPAPPKAMEMDFHLHRERLRRDRITSTFRARMSELPDGTMVSLPGPIRPGPIRPGPIRKAMLVRKGRLLEWTPGGYVGTQVCGDGFLDVLTPKSSVAALKAGYLPLVHPSGEQLVA